VNSQKEYLQRLELILVVGVVSAGVAIRLINIQQPFVDAWSWRQADVAMIAENFYLNGFKIFYPQVNWAGDSTGYVGTEFQVVPFVASLLYVFFGVQNWIGRSVSVFCFAASAPFLYFLVKKVSNERSALFAVVFYTLAPLSIFAARSFMPDTASLSCSIIAVYLFRLWLDQERDLRLFAGLCLATTLSILIKLPAVMLGLPLLYMSWTKYGPRLFFQRRLWVYAILSLIPPLIWYVHAYFISITYFPYHMFGSGLVKTIEIDKYGKIFLNTLTLNLTPVTSVFMVIGIILPTDKQFGRLFHWWLVAIIAFVVIIGEGNFRHAWYQLPLVPVAAAFAGVALDFTLAILDRTYHSRPIPIVTVLSLLTLLSYLSYFYVKPLYSAWAIPSFKAGDEINRIAPPRSLIIVPGSGDPTTIYHSKRRGWHFLGDGRIGSYPANSELAIRDVENLRRRGAAYFILTSNTLWYLDWYKDLERHLNSHYRQIADGHNYLIFDLGKKN
jgi:hypothetical protein